MVSCLVLSPPVIHISAMHTYIWGRYILRAPVSRVYFYLTLFVDLRGADHGSQGKS